MLEYIEYIEFGVLSFVTIVTLGLMLHMVLDSKNDIAMIDAVNNKYKNKNNGFRWFIKFLRRFCNWSSNQFRTFLQTFNSS